MAKEDILRIPAREFPALLKIYGGEENTARLEEVIKWAQEMEENSPNSVVTPHGHVYQDGHFRQLEDGGYVAVREGERKFTGRFPSESLSGLRLTKDEESASCNPDSEIYVPEGILDAMEADAQKLLKIDEYKDQKLEYVVQEHASCTSCVGTVYNPEGKEIFNFHL